MKTERPQHAGCVLGDPSVTATYLAGELSAAECRDFEAHLAGCPACSAAVEADRRLLARLAQVPRAQVSHDLAPAILARLDETRARPIRACFRPAWVRAAAAVALLLGGIVLLYRLGGGTGGAATAATPTARAAEWLCRTQEADGSWSTARWGGSRRYEPALTALSLLALLDAHAGAGAEGRAAADRAVRYLCSRQNGAGGFGETFDGAPYNDGMVALALLRAYQSRHDESLKPVLDRAVSAIVSRQLRDGGWGYVGQQTPASNLSITLWQVEALRMAASLGWAPARTPAGRGLRWIVTVGDEDGGFGYRQAKDFPEGSRTLAAMGAMSLFDAGEGSLVPAERRAAIRARISRMAAQDAANVDYYGGYVLSAALRRMGEDSARQSLATMQNALAARQVRQGADDGSWNADDRWSTAGGRVYATAMASLSLQ